MLSLFLPALLALASTGSGQTEISPAKLGSPYQTGVITIQRSSDARDAVCYKMRTYIFERNDGAAPKLIRETTCPPVRPRLNRSQMPRARVIPAN